MINFLTVVLSEYQEFWEQIQTRGSHTLSVH